MNTSFLLDVYDTYCLFSARLAQLKKHYFIDIFDVYMNILSLLIFERFISMKMEKW